MSMENATTTMTSSSASSSSPYLACGAQPLSWRTIYLSLLFTACISLVLTKPVEANYRICGHKLTITLVAMCKSNLCGSPIARRKRWYPFIDARNEFDNAIPVEEEFVDVRGPNLFKYYHRNVKRNTVLTDKCCRNRCTANFLKSYCCPDMALTR